MIRDGIRTFSVYISRVRKTSQNNTVTISAMLFYIEKKTPSMVAVWDIKVSVCILEEESGKFWICIKFFAGCSSP